MTAVWWIVGSEQHRRDGGHFAGTLFFFGPLWLAIGVVPTAVAGYESPRHVYLASAGWAVVVAVLLDVIRTAARTPQRRRLAAAVGLVLLAFYGLRLQTIIGQWHTMAAVSHQVVRDVSAEALAAPPGSLLIIDPPLRSSEWSIPISLRPPFSSSNVAERAFIVSMRPLHCCREKWFQDTRRALRTWLEEHPGAPFASFIGIRSPASSRGPRRSTIRRCGSG